MIATEGNEFFPLLNDYSIILLIKYSSLPILFIFLKVMITINNRYISTCISIRSLRFFTIYMLFSIKK